MGKFKFSYTSSFLVNIQGSIRNGIGFYLIRQVIDALPGETFVLGVSKDIPTDTWTVEAENYNFSDNTVVVPKYTTKTIISANGRTHSYSIFDGIDIIDPPVATPQPNYSVNKVSGYTAQPITRGGNYTVPVNGNITVPITMKIYGNLAATTPGPGQKVFFKDLVDVKCTCGAEKVGGLHSGWCDKHA